MGSTLFRDPQAWGSALAALGMLQPQAFGSLKSVEPLDSVSNYYVEPERSKGSMEPWGFLNYVETDYNSD